MDQLDQLLQDLDALGKRRPASAAAPTTAMKVPAATASGGTLSRAKRIDLSELDELVRQLEATAAGELSLGTIRGLSSLTESAKPRAVEPATSATNDGAKPATSAVIPASATETPAALSANVAASAPAFMTVAPATAVTTALDLCGRCHQPVGSNAVTALNQKWHPEHFSCAQCAKALATLSFFDREGKPYCDRCYNDVFVPKCAYCDGIIRDACITALGKTWHPDHFFCSQCGKNFPDGEFLEHDGKAYCNEDYYNMFAPKCSRCDQAITGEFINALNQAWHADCFNCSECHGSFANGSFFEYDGRPYCEKHYYSQRGAICGGCQKPVIGRCVTALGKRFHPEHFVCDYCKKQLVRTDFKEEKTKVFCKPCHVKLYQ